MSLSEGFSALGFKNAGNIPDATRRRKREAPFAIRLNKEERARLLAEARGVPLGTYIKSKALGSSVPLHMRRSGLSIEDRQALAQVLALLGRSHLANNLNQLARAVHSGSLPLTAETESELLAAIRDVREIRRQLLIALGMKPEASS